MTQENLERGVVSVRTVMAMLISGVLGTIGVMTFLFNISSQVSHVSSQVDLTNQTVASLQKGQDELHEGQTAIWTAVHGNTETLNEHGLSIQELKDAVNKDAHDTQNKIDNKQ